MASNLDGDFDNLSQDHKSNILAQRRCILLALIGSTSPSNIAVKGILESGYLVVVKGWLDDILNGNVGKLSSLKNHPRNLPLILPLLIQKNSQSKAIKLLIKITWFNSSVILSP